MLSQVGFLGFWARLQNINGYACKIASAVQHGHSGLLVYTDAAYATVDCHLRVLHRSMAKALACKHISLDHVQTASMVK